MVSLEHLSKAERRGKSIQDLESNCWGAGVEDLNHENIKYKRIFIKIQVRLEGYMVRVNAPFLYKTVLSELSVVGFVNNRRTLDR